MLCLTCSNYLYFKVFGKYHISVLNCCKTFHFYLLSKKHTTYSCYLMNFVQSGFQAEEIKVLFLTFSPIQITIGFLLQFVSICIFINIFFYCFYLPNWKTCIIFILSFSYLQSFSSSLEIPNFVPVDNSHLCCKRWAKVILESTCVLRRIPLANESRPYFYQVSL